MVKNTSANAGDVGLMPELGKFPGKENGQPTPVFLPEKSHGERSIVSYKNKRVANTVAKELDMT